jgi:hypothetical protein
VKELVQVDLSNCTSWNRFLEVISESISQQLLGTVFVEILLKENSILSSGSFYLSDHYWMYFWKGKVQNTSIPIYLVVVSPNWCSGSDILNPKQCLESITPRRKRQ